MAKNRVQDGKVIQYTNAGANVSSGDAVVIGILVGIALVDIATGQTGSVAITQVYNFAKADAAVIAQGETVLLDVSAGEVDDNAAAAASGDVLGWGIAFESKGVTVGETIAVKLMPNADAVVTP